MKRKLMPVLFFITLICFSKFNQAQYLNSEAQIKQKFYQVKVAVLYENITDGVLIGRSIDETVNLLKETSTNLIFRGFWKWAPIVNSPDSIPHQLLELAPVGTTPEQAAENLRKSGHYYEELKRWIVEIKKEIPEIIFVGAIPAQTLGRIEYNPITGRIYSMEETWGMALDPQKWNIMINGSPLTKKQFQSWWYGVHPYGGEIEQYDWQKVPAYFPDITNIEVQGLLLSWAKKQIDCGADAIWIDMLYQQAMRLFIISENVNHPSVKESVDAASKIVDEIHEYGNSIGRYIQVGSWGGPFVFSEIAGQEFPYSPPKLDFITTSPVNKEILDKKLDSARWEKEMPAIRKKYGNIPVYAFIDWSFDSSQTVMFSQKLSSEEQKEVLKTFDESFANLGINFVYPVHGGYMGRGEITTKLAWGKYGTYDALAPEFDTYQTIKELAQSKSITSVKEDSETLPTTLKLEQNYPNPFNPATTIRFSIPHAEHVVLKVYDILGREIVTLVNDELSAGEYAVVFNAKDLASGIYFYRLHLGTYCQQMKMTVLK